MDNTSLQGHNAWSEIRNGLGSVGLSSQMVKLDRDAWMEEVHFSHTQLGYWEWVKHKIEEFDISQITFVSRRKGETRFITSHT